MSILIDLLFPIRCAGCRKVGQYLCKSCRENLVFRSIKGPSRLSLFRYHGAIKKIISDLKFNFVADVTSELVDFITSGICIKYPSLLQYWQDNKFVLVPIPLHERRYLWRGFNQSTLVGELLAKRLKLSFDPDILIRTQNTLPQTAIKDKLLRKTNIQDSFELKIKNSQNIILFDDVYTTGSTIKSAISAFPKDTNIWVFTIAG